VGGAQLELRILGPLEAVRDGAPVNLPRPKQRALLASLLLHAGDVVSTDRLIEDVWGREPPRTALPALQGLVADLRKALGEELIVTRAPGYALELGQASFDLHRFERLVEDGVRARSAGNPARGAALLRESLELWRGAPLADFAFADFAQEAIARLEELRVVAVEERIEAELALGRHAELVGGLEALVAAQPLRERARGQLMLALYRSGRQAEALEAYQDARRALVEELGIDPSPALQRLERSILNHDPSLDLEAPARPALPTGTVTLLFTDIEGSTRLLHELGDGYRDLLLEHRRLFRAAVTEHGGYEVDTQGDAHFCVFEHAGDAVVAAASAQRSFAGHRWPAGVELRVRMGVHTGEPTPVEWGYVGVDLHRAARICAAAHGGQVLVSAQTRSALEGDAELEAAGVSLRGLGEHRLKDLPEPEALAQLAGEGLLDEFPPPRSAEAAPLPVQAPERSILVAPESGETLAALLAVAEPLARSEAPHELIVNRLVDPPGKELREATVALAELRSELLERRIASRTAAFTSADRVRDLVRTATDQNVDLLLADCPMAVLGGELPEDVRRLLDEAPCDVALLVARAGEGPGAGRAVVVPFGGAEHDWAALELAAWIASATGAPLVLAGTAGDVEAGQRDASRLLAVASMMVQGLVGVVAEPLLVEPGAAGLVQAAQGAGLLVLPFPEDWRSVALGPVRTAAARDSEAPVVLVRRGLRPGGLAPPENLTRFTWSVGSR
jgi:DNA-binding SARP family transcriptional activator